MSACTFFGHRDCPDTVKPGLYAAIENLIEEFGVDTFYVGNQGQFDACVRSVLREIQKERPGIRYAVVLAYLPTARDREDTRDTMFPEGLESVLPRYAVDRRNRWMLAQSEYVICYVRRTWGGAAKFVQLAKA